MGIASEFLEKVGLKFSEELLEKGGSKLLEKLIEDLGEKTVEKLVTEMGEKGFEKLFTDAGPKTIEAVAEKLGTEGVSKISAKEFSNLVEKEAEKIGEKGLEEGYEQGAKAASANNPHITINNNITPPAAPSVANAGAAAVTKAEPGIVKQAVTRAVNTTATGLGVGVAVAVPAVPAAIAWSYAQKNAAIQATANETHADPEVVKKFFNDFTAAGGEGEKADAAFKDFNDNKVKDGDRQKWIADRVENDKLPWYEKLFKSIAKIFSDPKSLGTDSLIGAVGLGLAGAWLGGGFSATGIGLGVAGALVGMVVPALVSKPSFTPSATPAVAAQNTGGAAVTTPAAQVQPEVTVPIGLPTAATQPKPALGTSPRAIG